MSSTIDLNIKYIYIYIITKIYKQNTSVFEKCALDFAKVKPGKMVEKSN